MDMGVDEDMKQDEDLPASFNAKSFMESYLDKLKFPSSPRTPTSVLPDFSNMKSAEDRSIVASSTPLLLTLRVKAIKKLSPIDIKRLSFHMYPHVAQQVTNSFNQMEKSKRDSEVIEDYVVLVDKGEGIRDGFVKLEVLQPQLQLKSIVAADDVQLIPAATPPMPPLSSVMETPLLSEARPLPEREDCVGSENISLRLPMAAGNVPLPPPPPPLPLLTTITSLPLSPPSPPSLTSSSIKTPPPPPRPPPLPISTSRIETPPPPPPPPISTVRIATPHQPSPPPPPMASADATIMGLPAPPPTSGKPGPPPPPPAPMTPRSIPQPPIQQGKGGAPPPPPAIGGTRSLRAKATTKLKRSAQMGSLYRLLKGKVEGSSLDGNSLKRKGSKVGTASSGNGKQGMADALAEMTKRSSYFIQIEEDVKNYANSIKEVKAALSSFQTTDMAELINFHEYVESNIEKLTDETQVLARFEDFPSKKLEGLRMAAALYAKLDAMATTLQNWKIESPVNQLIDKVENYFNKIKGDLDTLDRTKDDELKKFKSQNIHFDFGILVRIKELMVEVSSNCMELALKETREPRAEEHKGSGLKSYGKKTGSGKILWRAFQFAFRVYTFTGGQDDRADNLTRELAQEIETDPQQ